MSKVGLTIEFSKNRITQVASDICRVHAGSEVELTFAEKVLPDDWGRNRVWRYQVSRGSSGFPASLIVKVSKIGGGHIFNEWASLQFLNQFKALVGVVPAFYGGNEALELLVLEDLGQVRGRFDLGAILEGDDPVLAREALIRYARQMALLHATTAAYEKQFNRIRAQFPAYDQPLSKDQVEGNFDWFLGMLPRFDLSASAGLVEETQAITARLNDPYAPRAYSRGDVCPSNVAYHDQKMRFYDFEMGAFRNLFLSAAYFRISHLSCLNGNLIPLEIQAEAEEVYFQMLEPLVPETAVSQVDYAASAAAMLIWILSIYLEKKERRRHLATLHQRVFAALTLYIQHDKFTTQFPHLAKAITGLRQKLDQRWTDEEKHILLFPAFQ